jgi:biotin carboxyl carrier protein
MDDDGIPPPMPAVSAGAPSAAAPVARPVSAPPPAPKAAPAGGGDGKVLSPLAGTVVKVQYVEAGQTVVTLEAMKMNTDLGAPTAGTVHKVHINDGAVVGEGAVLVEIG